MSPVSRPLRGCRRIVERREDVKILGMGYKLLARVEVLNGFSAHADLPS